MNEELIIPSNLRLTPREEELAMAVAYLIKKRSKYGISDHTVLEEKSPVIIKYAIDIFKVWSALYPDEWKLFISNTEFERDVEKSSSQLLKQGGYSPTSYPMKLDQLFKTLMPGVKTQDKRFYRPFMREIPAFKRSRFSL